MKYTKYTWNSWFIFGTSLTFGVECYFISFDTLLSGAFVQFLFGQNFNKHIATYQPKLANQTKTTRILTWSKNAGATVFLVQDPWFLVSEEVWWRPRRRVAWRWGGYKRETHMRPWLQSQLGPLFELYLFNKTLRLSFEPKHIKQQGNWKQLGVGSLY